MVPVNWFSYLSLPVLSKQCLSKRLLHSCQIPILQQIPVDLNSTEKPKKPPPKRICPVLPSLFLTGLILMPLWIIGSTLNGFLVKWADHHFQMELLCKVLLPPPPSKWKATVKSWIFQNNPNLDNKLTEIPSLSLLTHDKVSQFPLRWRTASKSGLGLLVHSWWMRINSVPSSSSSASYAALCVEIVRNKIVLVFVKR